MKPELGYLKPGLGEQTVQLNVVITPEVKRWLDITAEQDNRLGLDGTLGGLVYEGLARVYENRVSDSRYSPEYIYKTRLEELEIERQETEALLERLAKKHNTIPG